MGCRGRFDNQVAWARFYLAKAGLIDTSHHGVWTLTELGRQTQLDHQNAFRIFKEVQQKYQEAPVIDSTDETQAPEQKPED
jgi:restriction endonuclease Mrr